jgi:Phage tail assembly chaperone protein, TAC
MSKTSLTPNLKTEVVVIDDLKFETTQFPAMRAYKLMTKLVKHLGPAIAMLGAADGDVDIRHMAPALGAALGSMNDQDAASLLLEVLGCTTIELEDASINLGSQKSIDGVFSGRLSVMFQVAAHALKVNYQDFFSGSAESTPEAAGTLPNPSQDGA